MNIHLDTKIVTLVLISLLAGGAVGFALEHEGREHSEWNKNGIQDPAEERGESMRERMEEMYDDMRMDEKTTTPSSKTGTSSSMMSTSTDTDKMRMDMDDMPMMHATSSR